MAGVTFSKITEGYSPREVEEYITLLETEYAKALNLNSAQKKQIEEYKAKWNELFNEEINSNNTSEENLAEIVRLTEENLSVHQQLALIKEENLDLQKQFLQLQNQNSELQKENFRLKNEALQNTPNYLPDTQTNLAQDSLVEAVLSLARANESLANQKRTVYKETVTTVPTSVRADEIVASILKDLEFNKGSL